MKERKKKSAENFDFLFLRDERRGRGGVVLPVGGDLPRALVVPMGIHMKKKMHFSSKMSEK
jgi:hypothetical protein